MDGSRTPDAGLPQVSPEGRLRPELPSWLMSVGLHVAILLVLGLTLPLAAGPRGTGERTAQVGIALKHFDGQSEYYQSEGDGGGESRAAAGGGSAVSSLDDLLRDASPVDPSPSLPSAINVIGRGALGEDGVPNAGGMSDGPGKSRGSLGGGARVHVFGVEGEGHKFVYVFDRSGSMGGSGRSPLSAAKTELIDSLESLEDVHQFQIIFYNETPTRFNPAGQSGKLGFATAQNKERARRFVGSITADGSTRHEPALLEAIRLQPDVIFFLTDADVPQLSASQLERISQRAAGITIHAIEFGIGPQRDPNNFLVRLARKNGGQHKYVDISRLRLKGTR